MALTISQPVIKKISVRDYLTLMKPRVMSLSIFTGIVGMFLAPGQLSFPHQCIAIFALALGGGASGAINMWLERDLDARMVRTQNRPLPAGRLTPANAITFALISAVIAVVLMATVNMLASFLLLFTILFYTGVYTLWLKPTTPQSIVIGGAAGALPPVIGWAAVTGNVALEPLLMFLIIFLWTPPHFWALALVKSDEYRAAGIPALPVVVGTKATIKQMLIYSALLFVSAMLPAVFHETGLLYAVGAFLLSAGFLFHAVRLWKEQTIRLAMPLFFYSLIYIAALFLLLVIDRIVYA